MCLWEQTYCVIIQQCGVFQLNHVRNSRDLLARLKPTALRFEKRLDVEQAGLFGSNPTQYQNCNPGLGVVVQSRELQSSRQIRLDIIC